MTLNVNKIPRRGVLAPNRWTHARAQGHSTRKQGKGGVFYGRRRSKTNAQNQASHSDLIGDELSAQLERLRIAERENALLKAQIEELESELDLDFDALEEMDATFESHLLSKVKSEEGLSGPSLPEVEDISRDVTQTQEESPSEVVVDEEPQVEAVIPVEEVEEVVEEEMIQQEVVQQEVVQQEVVEEQVEEEMYVESSAQEEVIEEEVEEVQAESSDMKSMSELPGTGKMWSKVPRASVRVGKAGVTADLVKSIQEQVADSELGLAKVQLFNKSLEPLEVANQILSLSGDFYVLESKGRTLLFSRL